MAKSANIIGTGNPSRSKTTLTCKTCGSLFHPWLGREKTSAYCTRPCAYADKNRMPKRNLEDRFWEKVDRRGPDDCWPWLGHRSGDWYGRVYSNGKQIGAHRVSYLIHNGELPKGAFICHTCDNPGCVNPKHLYAGTPATNVKDMDQRGRRVTNTVRGEDHPLAKLTPEKVRAIRASKLPARKIAAEFGVSPSLIDNIRARRTWKHV